LFHGKPLIQGQVQQQHVNTRFSEQAETRAFRELSDQLIDLIR
jgi:hypothetical protein